MRKLFVALALALLATAALAGTPARNVVTTFCGAGGPALTGGTYSSTSLSDWTASNSTLTANDHVSNDCTRDASSFVENTANATHNVNQTAVSALTAAVHTATLYVARTRIGAQRWVDFTFSGGSGGSAAVIIDLNTCTPSTAVSVAAAWSAGSTTTQAVGGWCKIVTTVTTVLEASFGLTVFDTNAAGFGGVSFIGDGVSGLTVWGADVR